MTDRLIRLTTALAVVAVAGVAATISHQHAYELVALHGETGLTARLLPFTVDGLIWAAYRRFALRRHPGIDDCYVPPENRWWYSTRAAGTTAYHDRQRGASVRASWRRLAPTWHTTWATAR